MTERIIYMAIGQTVLSVAVPFNNERDRLPYLFAVNQVYTPTCSK